MARIEPFEAHTGRYEAWFERHDAAWISELLALRPFVPLAGRVTFRRNPATVVSA